MTLLEAFKILLVDSSSTKESVKLSYRKLVRRWHPDITDDKIKAHEMMILINSAYDIVCERLITIHSVDRWNRYREVAERRSYQRYKKYVWDEIVSSSYMNTKYNNIAEEAITTARLQKQKTERIIGWLIGKSFIAQVAVGYIMGIQKRDKLFVRIVEQDMDQQYLDLKLIMYSLVLIVVLRFNTELTTFVLNAQEHLIRLGIMLLQIH